MRYLQLLWHEVLLSFIKPYFNELCEIMDWNSLSNSMLIDIDRGFLIARLKLSINCCKKDRFFESNLQRKFFGKEIVDIIFNRCISEDMVVFDWLSSNCQNGLAFFRSFCSLLTSENQATLFPH